MACPGQTVTGPVPARGPASGLRQGEVRIVTPRRLKALMIATARPSLPRAWRALTSLAVRSAARIPAAGPPPGRAAFDLGAKRCVRVLPVMPLTTSVAHASAAAITGCARS